MKIILLCLALALFGPLCAPAKATDAQAVERVVATGPLPCLTQALDLANRQMRRMIEFGLLAGIGQSTQAGAGWKPGNPYYDRARGTLAQALDEDEKTFGRLFSLTTESLLREWMARQPADVAPWFADFLSRPAGKFYWKAMIDGAHCEGVVNGLRKWSGPWSDADTRAAQALLNDLAAARNAFPAQLATLSKADQSEFDAGFKKLGGSLGPVAPSMMEKSMTSLEKRLGDAIQGRATELKALAVRHRDHQPLDDATP